MKKGSPLLAGYYRTMSTALVHYNANVRFVVLVQISTIGNWFYNERWEESNIKGTVEL